MYGFWLILNNLYKTPNVHGIWLPNLASNCNGFGTRMENGIGDQGSDGVRHSSQALTLPEILGILG